MFNPELLNPEVQDFIRDYHGSVESLAFAGSPFKNISVQELIQQIQNRERAKSKIPLWYETPNILFPPKLNLEQTSSEITAKYKASLISGNTLADLTGGFGIDSFYFSEQVATVHHFEINEELSALATHNFKVLGKDNIQCHVQNGVEAALNQSFDVIYADPSRRHDSKGKVFFLRNCEPNIPEVIDQLLDKCKVFLLKTSPMLDISIGIEELRFVEEIHIVAVANEVKELLWILKKEPSENIKIKTVNFGKSETEEFEFILGERAIVQYDEPKTYLYEPNVAILKSGGFDLISKQFNLQKLHQHTHLYTNDTLIEFPGRRFRIQKRVPYRKSEIRKAFDFDKANVAIRNFPESVSTLRKKWKIKDGGDVYLFFVTTSNNQKEVLICSKA